MSAALGLVQLAELIERRLDAIAAEHGPEYPDCRGRWAAAEKLVDELVREHGARFRLKGAHDHHFRFGGIAISCTSGHWNLLSGWARKARAAAPLKTPEAGRSPPPDAPNSPPVPDAGNEPAAAGPRRSSASVGAPAGTNRTGTGDSNMAATSTARNSAPPDPCDRAPLDRLVLSPLNARKTYADEDIASLADNIHERGLHQNLVVSKSPTRRGFFEVDAGGRRWRALKRNVELGRLAADWPAPVKLVPRDQATEASLDENIHKIPLNPADEVLAYLTIIEGYEAEGTADPAERVAQCARRRGVTVRHVEQRLRLAALAPGILDALRVGKISLDAAKAYAGIADQKVQLQVFEAEESKEQHRLGWGHSPIAIRDAINGRVYTPEHKAVRFVGLDAYIAAGGRVERDLFFGAEDRELLLDPAIVDRLAEEKAEAEAARLAQAAGFGQGATKSWLAPRHAEPKAPAGFQAVYREPPADVRAEAVQAFEIAEDGSGLKPIDRWFVKAEGKPAATYGREAEEQAAARAHRRLVEIRAARLAVPPIAGSPLEGMAYWPPNDGYVPTFEPAADCDGVVVAMLIKVPADQVAAMRERAEWALAEEEAAAAAAARTAPAEDASEAGTSDDEVPAETPAELEEPVS